MEKINWWRWFAYAFVTGLIALTIGIRLSNPGFNFHTKHPSFFSDDSYRLLFRIGAGLFGFGIGPLLSQAYDFVYGDGVRFTTGPSYTRASRWISVIILFVGIILMTAATLKQRHINTG